MYKCLCIRISNTAWLPMSLFLFPELTYLITPCSRVLLKNPTGSQLVEKFPALCGTWRFITAFTSDRHFSLPWPRSIHFLPPHTISRRSILILYSNLRLGLPNGLIPSGLQSKHCVLLSCTPYLLHIPPISFVSIWSPEKYWVRNTDHYPLKDLH